MHLFYPFIPLTMVRYFKIFTPSPTSQDLLFAIIYEKISYNNSQLSVLGLIQKLHLMLCLRDISGIKCDILEQS